MKKIYLKMCPNDQGRTLISPLSMSQQLVLFLGLVASSTLAAPHVPDALLLTILTRGPPHFHTHNAMLLYPLFCHSSTVHPPIPSFRYMPCTLMIDQIANAGKLGPYQGCPHFHVHHGPNTLLYPVSLYLGNDHHRNPNINNRDHLVGQLTTVVQLVHARYLLF